VLYRSLCALLVAAPALLACRDDPPVERHYPMRAPTHADPARAEPPAPAPTTVAEQPAEGQPPKRRERPTPDPGIEATLTTIANSGLRFIDQAEDPDSRATEYSAAEFVDMLRSKWDWIGYDITAPDVFIREIATRSFKTNLPYLVVLQDGTTIELQAWLASQQQQQKP
jgi:hypothetical protein